MSDSNTFVCQVCFENAINPRNVVGHLVCPDCLTILLSQFHDAIKSELSYPITAWSIELRPEDFADVFGTENVLRYQRREIEYKTLPKDRIYCANKILSSTAPQVGATHLDWLSLTPTEYQKALDDGDGVEDCGAMIASRKDTNAEDLVPCWRCLGTTKVPELQEHDDDTKAFEGLTRGKDYQICPDCGTTIQLRDGCNHVTCALRACPNSRTGFCFICGKGNLPHSSPHWGLPGGCPRYNQPAQRPVVQPAPVQFQPVIWDPDEEQEVELQRLQQGLLRDALRRQREQRQAIAQRARQGLPVAYAAPRPVDADVQAIQDHFLPAFDAFIAQYQEQDAVMPAYATPTADQIIAYTEREQALTRRVNRIHIQIFRWVTEALTNSEEHRELSRRLGTLRQSLHTVIRFGIVFHRVEFNTVRIRELRDARAQVEAALVDLPEDAFLRARILDARLLELAQLVNFYRETAVPFVEAALARPPTVIGAGIGWAYEY